ncbi:MAG: LacI family transcriptional regulator, partial [Actinomycetales bacterium]
EHPDLDGLFAASDLMAAGALRALAEAGRSVPGDVAVVGYDDLEVAERTSPTLTTVRNPVGEMVERATRLLLDQLADVGEREAEQVVFPPALVSRDSA